MGTRRNRLPWTVSRKLRENRQISLNVRPCLYWGLSHLWSVTNAAGLLPAPGSHQMIWLEWKSGEDNAQLMEKGDLVLVVCMGMFHPWPHQGESWTRDHLMFSVLLFPTSRVGAAVLGQMENFREKGVWRDCYTHEIMVLINKQPSQAWAAQNGCCLVFLKVLNSNQKIGRWRGGGKKSLNCCNDMSV